MPFTPAHIAAVLPFRKWAKQDVFTMLALGSVIPDMEYFLFFNPASGFSHTIKGVFLFDLPLCITVFYLWKLFIGEMILATLPCIKNHGASASKKQNIFILIVAALTGITTHLLWDSFTHGKGYFVQQFDVLQHQITLGFIKIKMCYLLWYVCSILGTCWVIYTFFTFKKQGDGSSYPVSDFWLKVLFSTLMIAVIRIAMGLSHNVPRHLVIIVIGAFLYSFLIISYSEFNTMKNKNRHL